ncbi:MAG: CHAT domain-containing protein [bacterium]
MKLSRRILGLAIVVVIFAAILIYSIQTFFQKNIYDFEEAITRESNRQQQYQIVEDVIAYLSENTIVPDSVKSDLQARLTESAQNTAYSLPNDFGRLLESLAMSDSLCAMMESKLMPFLAHLHPLIEKTDSTAFQKVYSQAQQVAQKIDDWNGCSYWWPLLQHLQQADKETFSNWQMAKLAFRIAGSYQGNVGKYELSKQVAVYGLQCLGSIPDRRLFLDLCLRLQSAIWFHDATYYTASAFGEWVIQQCDSMGYPFRAVSQEYNIANQLIVDGQYSLAIDRLQNVLTLIQKWDFFNSGNWQWYNRAILRGLAVSYKNLGETEKAIYYNDKFAEVIQSRRDKALHHKINAELAKDTAMYDKAEVEFEKALDFVISTTPNGKKIEDYFSSWAIYIALADLRLKYDVPDRAVAVLEEWEELAHDNPKFLEAPDRAARHALYKAKALIRKEEFDRAAKLLAFADKNIQKINSPKVHFQFLMRSAEQYAANQNHEIALQQLRTARALCIEKKFYIGEIDVILKMASISQNVDSAFEAGSVQPELEGIIRKIRTMGYKPMLIRALAEIIRENLRNKQFETAKEYSELLFHEVALVRDSLISNQRLVYLGHGTNHALNDAILADIFLRKKTEAFARLNYAKSFASKQNFKSNDFRNIDIERLSAQLEPDEAVVDYLVAQDTVFAFLLTRSSFELVAMQASRTRLQLNANRYLQLLSKEEAFVGLSTKEEYGELFETAVDSSHVLYNHLFQKLEPFLENVTTIYVIPDGFLHNLPFATLATSQNAPERFLIEDKAISYLPGAWMIAEDDETIGVLPGKSYIASVGPGVYLGKKFIREIQGTALKDMLTVHTAWNGKASLKNTLEAENEIVLFFSHAQADWDDPTRSFVTFPLQNDKTGKLYYADVDSLDLSKTNLVILAACETAGSRIYLGTGLTGLQRAFLANGANQVLATYWKVLPDFTVNAVNDFIEALAKGKKTTLALQEMQRELIRKLRKRSMLQYQPFPQIWGAYNLTSYRKNSAVSISTRVAGRTF